LPRPGVPSYEQTPFVLSKQRCTHPTSKRPISTLPFCAVPYAAEKHASMKQYYAVIRCFAGIQHESDNNFTRFAVFAVQITQARLFAP